MDIGRIILIKCKILDRGIRKHIAGWQFRQWKIRYNACVAEVECTLSDSLSENFMPKDLFF